MVRNYKRKSDRQSVSDQTKEAIIQDVLTDKMSFRVAAEKYSLPKSSKYLLIKNHRHEPKHHGYNKIALKQMVFTPEQEAALTSHLKALDERFFGLSAIQCRELAYQ